MFKKITTIFESFDVRLKEVTHETPITVASLISLFFVASYGIFNSAYLFEESRLIACGLTLMFAVLFSYIVHKFMGKKKHLWSIGIVVISALLYYTFIPKSSEIFYSDIWYTLLFLNGCLALILLVAPFVKSFINKKPEKNDIYFNYMMRVVVTTVQAVFVAGVLTLLTFAAFWALDSLFNLSLQGELFGLVFAFASIIVAPLFWLTEMKGTDTTKLLPRTFLKVVVLYIGIPFAVIYMLILYAYSVRVLINISDWPEASISWLIIVFSVFGWLLFISSYPFRENTLVALFRKYFSYIALPQTIMLFYAIYLRIAQYGWTIDRYLVVSFGIGILFFALYTILSKSKHLIVYPLAFVVVILISITGPWGMSNVSVNSQIGQLEKRLTSLGIYNEGQITKITDEQVESAARDDLESAVSIVRYLCGNHGCDSMEKLLPEAIFETEKQNQSTLFNSRISEYTILDNLGLGNIYFNSNDNRSVESYSLFNYSEDTVISVAEFETFQFVESYRKQDSNRIVIEYKTLNGAPQSKDITEDFIAYVKEYGQPSGSFQREISSNKVLPPMIIEDVTLHLQRASITLDRENVDYDLSGYLFTQ